MSLILLESLANNAIIRPSDGATVNFLASGRKNGRVKGAAISLSGRTFTMAEGTLIARGHRIKCDASTQILDLSGATLPASETAYRLIARISRSGDSGSLTITHQLASSSLNNDPIDEGNGTYDLSLGTFLMGPNGVYDFSDALPTVTGSSSGGSSSPPRGWRSSDTARGAC